MRTTTHSISDILQLLDDETARSIDVDILAYGLDSGPLRNQHLGQSEGLDGWHVQLRNTWQQPKITHSVHKLTNPLLATTQMQHLLH